MPEPRQSDVDRVTEPDALDEQAIRADERVRIDHESRATDHVGDDLGGRDDPRDREVAAVDRVTIDADEPIEVVRRRSFSFGQLLTMAAGAALLALGIAAVVATGIDTPLDEPVESVLGWDHTPLLGLIEIVAGGLLVLFSLRPGGRWLSAVVGLALVVGGLAILIELDWTVEELGAEQAYAWVPIVVGGVAVLAALLTPRRHQRMTGMPVVS